MMKFKAGRQGGREAGRQGGRFEQKVAKFAKEREAKGG
jgi:hypothetical protein